MGRSNMTSLKITLLPLAISLLVSLNSQVSGKSSPKYFIIETEEMAKNNFDYIDNINNDGKVKTIVDGSTNVDYVSNINNAPGGAINSIVDKSTNFDYIEGINNAAGGAVGTIGDKSFNVGKDYVNDIDNGGQSRCQCRYTDRGCPNYGPCG